MRDQLKVPSPENDATETDHPKNVSVTARRSIAVKLALAVTIILLILLSNVWFSAPSTGEDKSNWFWNEIDNAETALRDGYAKRPILYLSIAFVIYVVAVGLSLPISTLLSLSYAWLFQWTAVPLLNVAATCGATIAFLSARYLFRDWVQNRFGKHLTAINNGFKKEGAYYVVSLRMVALFPFFVVNLVLGLVPIKTRTYFFATMIGMLPLNVAFVYFGMQIPSVSEVAENGIGSLISFPVIFGIALVGVLPTLLKWWVLRKDDNDESIR